MVVTEYAEGQLFQILEDDGNLPESQVFTVTALLQDLVSHAQILLNLPFFLGSWNCLPAGLSSVLFTLPSHSSPWHETTKYSVGEKWDGETLWLWVGGWKNSCTTEISILRIKCDVISLQVCQSHERLHLGAYFYQGNTIVHVSWACRRETIRPHRGSLVFRLHPLWAPHGGASVLHKLHLPLGATHCERPSQVARHYERHLHGTVQWRSNLAV